MIKLIVLINRNSPECNILNIAKSHHIMIVATFLPTEINFGPISTNGNSICLSDTLYQQGPSAKGTDGIMSKNPTQQDFWFWSTYSISGESVEENILSRSLLVWSEQQLFEYAY